MAQPVSYFYFKLNLEIAHVSTYGRDEWVQKQYQKYLDNFKGVITLASLCGKFLTALTSR